MDTPDAEKPVRAGRWLWRLTIVAIALLIVLSAILYVKFVDQKLVAHSRLRLMQMYLTVLSNDCVASDVFVTAAGQHGWTFSDVSDEDYPWPVSFSRSEIMTAVFIGTGNDISTKEGGFYLYFDADGCLLVN